jgi:hypothetical protein
LIHSYILGANRRSGWSIFVTLCYKDSPLGEVTGKSGPDPKLPDDKRSAMINARVLPETKRILERIAGAKGVATFLEDLAHALRG